MKQKKLLALIGSICLVLVLTATSLMTACAEPAPSPTPSPEPAPYYAGKLITIWNGDQAGGGTDAMARLAAALLPKYLPGEPTIVVRNIPGGAGVIAVNSFYNTAKPDGLTLFQASSSITAMQLRRVGTVKYDLLKCVAIANVNRGGSIMVIRNEALSRLTDPNAEPVICGSKDGEEQWVAMPMYGAEFLGWNMRWILGYQGVPDFGMAIRRGEIDMFGTSAASIVKNLVTEDVAQLLVHFGVRQGVSRVPRPDFPDVPVFEDVLGENKPEGIPWEAYMAFVGPQLVDKLLLAPPGTPPEIIDILIDAYTKVSKDPEFDRRIRQREGEVYGVRFGEETVTLLMEVLTASPAALDYFNELQSKLGIK